MTDQETSDIRRLEHQMMVATKQAEETVKLARADAAAALLRIDSFFSVAKWIVTIFGVSGVAVMVTTLIWGVTLGNRVSVLEITDATRATHSDRITRLEETNIRIERSLDRIEGWINPRDSGRGEPPDRH